MLSLNGEITFKYNHAEIGGAIVATESEIYLSDHVNIVNNNASISGGGLAIPSSERTLQPTGQQFKHFEKHGHQERRRDSYCKFVNQKCCDRRVNGKKTEEFREATLNIIKNSAQREEACA